jgi:hypothetical protein
VLNTRSISASTMSSVWEKVCRLIAVHSKADLMDLDSIMTTLLSNIIKDPSNRKFRRLKMSNKSIKSRLCDRQGGIETLLALGFVVKVDESDGEKYLSLHEEEEALNMERIDLLQSSLTWFNDTATSISQSAANDHDPCAECIIQIKLPVGTSSIRGGFMSHESIAQVLTFAEQYFNEDKRGSVTLRQAHDPTDLCSVATKGEGEGEGGSPPSLRELGLGRKAKLICTSLNDSARATTLQQKTVFNAADDEGNAKFVVQSKQAVRKAVQDRKSDSEARKSEKESILSAFRDDRNPL